MTQSVFKNFDNREFRPETSLGVIGIPNFPISAQHLVILHYFFFIQKLGRCVLSTLNLECRISRRWRGILIVDKLRVVTTTTMSNRSSPPFVL
ncbi:hypothetical protein COCCADRAFT_92775 [Bipolaris zeicola 26-R-13]|uniref:Uncharacterized protein n=1 Tax=Cochliobolus carbonum (strain 26-R-13) TaxID=930089 RepID=W6Y9J7_COCC2|nr:uncharacterized protein COCCADRAFT_92775 [Bipolaris zeicola 26-R-13]EUC34653.1 hypothetical protein COCCADRAFT_92775 [Bipolaris zeicola 26-R-13]